MEDKCFCHFNGYRVKDAEARNRIEVLEDKIENIEIPEGDSKSTEYSMPLGLIAYGTNYLHSNELPHECDEELLKIVDDIMGTHEGAIESMIYPTDITIFNTSENIEVDGEIIPRVAPGFLKFDQFLIHYKNENEGEFGPTLDSITLLGYDLRGKSLYDDAHYEESSAKLLIQFVKSSETGEYTLTGVPGQLIIGKLEVTTTKYVDDAIANIELPEGEGGSYPIYHIYAPVGMSSNTTLQEDNALCIKLGEVFDDCTTNGFETALILVDAYSETYILSFKTNGLRSKANKSFTLTATKINGDTSTIKTTDFKVSFNILNNKFKIQTIKLTPYTINVASKEYVNDTLHGTLLYDSSVGSSSTIQLNTSDIANYKYIEVYYTHGDVYHFTKAMAINGNKICLESNYVNPGDSTQYTQTQVISITNNTLTFDSGSAMDHNSNGHTFGNSTTFKIMRVVGII